MAKTSGTPRSFVIARKEFREIFRDRRTMISVVVSPLIITPLLFAFLGGFIGNMTEKARTQQYNIAIVGGNSGSATRKALESAPNLTLADAANQADAEKRIREHKASAAVIMPADTEAKIAAQKSAPITILLNAGDEKSQAASGALEENFRVIGKNIVAQRIKISALPADFATPFQTKTQGIPGGSGPALAFLTMMLPYILILSAFGGAIYAAFDQVAGEKERGTLETLLVAPVSRRDIAIGKFGAVVGVCLVSSVLAIVGLAVPFYSGLKAYSWLAKGGLTLGPFALPVVLLALIPISVLFAGALLAVSTFARNQKEAQTYLITLMPLVMLPAIASMAIGSDVGLPVAFVPVLNAAVIIKQALNNNYNAPFIAVAFLSSLFYAAASLLFVTRLFDKESVLIKA